MKAQLTDWLDGSEKPVRDGFYERDYSAVSAKPNDIRRQQFRLGRWDGYLVVDGERRQSCYQNLPWRGLINEHSK